MRCRLASAGRSGNRCFDILNASDAPIGYPRAMPSQHNPDPQFATTLAHGLALLRSFSIGEPALSNKELAQRTGLSKATISRLTTTLAARGLVAFDAHQRRYRLASTALTIGYPLLSCLPIRQLARSRMKRLADEFGGTVSLGMRDRLWMVYVETSRGHDLSAWRPDIGASIPMLPTAMGRTWLAQAPAAAREQVLRELRAAEPAHWAAHAADLAQAIAELPRKGFCVSRGAWRPDVHAVSVPVTQPQDGETLVFNCGVLTTRLGPRTLEREVGPRLVQMVRELEAELVPPS